MEKIDLLNSFGYLVSKTNGLMRNQFNKTIKEKGFNTTAEQWGILHIINDFPGISQSDIAEKGLKDKTNITRMLDVLEKNKNIERKPVLNDRRIYSIYITKKGKKLLNDLIPIAKEMNKKSLIVLNEEEKNTLISLLRKIYENLIELN